MINKKDYQKKQLTTNSKKPCYRYDYFGKGVTVVIIFEENQGKRAYDIQISYEGETYKYYYTSLKVDKLMVIGYVTEGVEQFIVRSRSPFKTVNNIIESIVKTMDYKKCYLKAIKKTQTLLNNNNTIIEISKEIESDFELLSQKLMLVKSGVMSTVDLIIFLDNEIEKTNYPYKVG